MSIVLTLFNSTTGGDKSRAAKKLIEHSSPRQDFFLMVSLAVLMATFGLILDSMAVIIGSMLIAPLLYPVMSLALGIVITDTKLAGRSLFTLFKASVLGIVVSAVATVVFDGDVLAITPMSWFGSKTELISVAVAVTAGTAASFALIKPKLSETLPGIAISVAMIPPLATVGLAMAWLSWDLVMRALLIYLMNILGLVLASVVVFSLMGLYSQRNIIKKKMRRDEKDMKREAKLAKRGR